MSKETSVRENLLKTIFPIHIERIFLTIKQNVWAHPVYHYFDLTADSRWGTGFIRALTKPVKDHLNTAMVKTVVNKNLKRRYTDFKMILIHSNPLHRNIIYAPISKSIRQISSETIRATIFKNIYLYTDKYQRVMKEHYWKNKLPVQRKYGEGTTDKNVMGLTVFSPSRSVLWDLNFLGELSSRLYRMDFLIFIPDCLDSPSVSECIQVVSTRRAKTWRSRTMMQWQICNKDIGGILLFGTRNQNFPLLTPSFTIIN